MDDEKQECARVTSTTRNSKQPQACSITISHLDEPELQQLEAMSIGAQWVRILDGRVQAAPAYKAPPPPEEDPLIAPFWRPVEQGVQQILFEELKDHDSPSFTVQHLAPYKQSTYAVEAARLKTYGFACLRSPREADGRCWELWYLPGTWAAKGELAVAIRGEQDRSKHADLAINFLCRHVKFGTLDVSIQRAAMVFAD